MPTRDCHLRSGHWTGAICIVLLFSCATFSGFLPCALAQAPASRDGNGFQACAGVVVTGTGRRASGAMVRLSNVDRGLAFLIVSGTDGRFASPPLPSGRYTLQAISEGRQSAVTTPRGSEELARNETRLILDQPQDAYVPDKVLTAAEWNRMLPEGPGKSLLLSRCAFCHGIERIPPKRASEEEWMKIADRMRDNILDHKVPFSENERNTILDYLVHNFGPAALPYKPPLPPPRSLNGHLPRQPLRGAEAVFVSMEFDLDLPAGSWVMDLAIDSKGIVWVTERVAGKLGRFDPESLEFTQIAPPAGRFQERSLSSVAVDPNDHVWLTDNGPNGMLYDYDPASGKFASYRIPVPPNLGYALVQLRFFDGALWGSGLQASQIVRLDLATKQWKQFSIPKGSLPYGLAIGGDGNPWYVAHYDNEVVRLDRNSGTLVRHKVPTPRSQPRRMAADSKGDLWAGAYVSGKLLRVDHSTGAVAELTPPAPNPGLFAVDASNSNGWIWAGETNARRIARFDPTSKTFTEYPLSSADVGGEFSDPRVVWVRADPRNPRRVWWAGGTTPHPKIGYVEVRQDSK